MYTAAETKRRSMELLAEGQQHRVTIQCATSAEVEQVFSRLNVARFRAKLMGTLRINYSHKTLQVEIVSKDGIDHEAALKQGIADIKAGRTTPWAEVKDGLGIGEGAENLSPPVSGDERAASPKPRRREAPREDHADAAAREDPVATGVYAEDSTRSSRVRGDAAPEAKLTPKVLDLNTGKKSTERGSCFYCGEPLMREDADHWHSKPFGLKVVDLCCWCTGHKEKKK